MAQMVNPYFTLASTFQQTKIAAGETPAGAAFTGAKGQLKTAFAAYLGDRVAVDLSQLVKENFKEAAAQDKATKKFTDWLKKQPEAQNSEISFADACANFEKTYLASLESEPVLAARAAKKALKQATQVRFTAGESVETITGELTGLNAKTIAKIAYWAAKQKPAAA